MVMGRLRNLVFFLLFFGVLTGVDFTAGVVCANTQGSFSGTWTASGTRDLLPFGENRETALVRLSGHVNLADDLGETRDYWSTCIGLVDSMSGSDVRCVWRSLDGQEIYIVLRAEQLAAESVVEGEIVGGTGAAEGMTGNLGFRWSTLSFQKNNNKTEIGGYARDLKGSYRLP